MFAFRVTDPTQSRLPALAAALCWALAVGGAVLWWWHAPQGPELAASPAQTAVSAKPVNMPAMLRALGQPTGTVAAVADDAARRFQLLGVVAGASGQGAALVVVDGQPPQAFVQGQTVAEGWRLERLNPDGVRLTATGLVPLDLSVPERR